MIPELQHSITFALNRLRAVYPFQDAQTVLAKVLRQDAVWDEIYAACSVYIEEKKDAEKQTA